MTGVKISNLPLVLPWLVVLFFQWRYLLERSRPAVLAVAMVVCVVVSFLPVALLNIHFTGDYGGDPDNSTQMKLTNPVSAVLGNSLQLAKDNLVPPLLPHSIDWAPLLPSHLKANLLRDFPRMDLSSGELQIEEEAGLGLGNVLFASLFIVWGIVARFTAPGVSVVRDRQALAVAAAATIAWLAFVSKVGGEATSRLIASYYPLLIASILIMVSLDGRVVGHRLFKWIGVFAMLSAVPLVILCPARPLFPVHAVSDLMAKSHVPAGIVARYDQVYRLYAERSDAFIEMAACIPPGEHAIGFLQTGNAPEASLWRPFGTRRVVEVQPEDSAEKVKVTGTHFVIVSQEALDNRYHTTVALLAAKWTGSIVAEKSIVLTAHAGPKTWYLLQL